MARVFGPLLSLGASGDFGNAIQFACGKFVRAKSHNLIPMSERQRAHQAKFKEGANYWIHTLEKEAKEDWEKFAKILLKSAECASPGGRITGYTCWMMFWLKYYEEKWICYPYPPGFAPA